jgi:F0F1-type ATP synthase assembly protein I
MQFMSPIDHIPLGIFVFLCIGLMVAFIEVGYRLGQRHQGKPNKAQMAQVRAIMGASGGLHA